MSGMLLVVGKFDSPWRTHLHVYHLGRLEFPSSAPLQFNRLVKEIITLLPKPENPLEKR
jgi:hypothetical protein